MTKHNLSLKERFLLHVNIPEDLEDCWEWNIIQKNKRYASFRIGNKPYLAHRVSFELFVGTIPSGLVVCHSCDNGRCVSPKHLWLGTQQDNMKDASNKGRLFRPEVIGEKNGFHKLNEQDIYKIRDRIEQGHTNTEIAKDFDVSHATISAIRLRKRWGWLP